MIHSRELFYSNYGLEDIQPSVQFSVRRTYVATKSACPTRALSMHVITTETVAITDVSRIFTHYCMACNFDRTLELEQVLDAVWADVIKTMDNECAKVMFTYYCKWGNLGRVKELEEVISDCFDQRAVSYACEKDHIDVVKHLQQTYGDRIDLTTNKNYALEICCKQGHADILQFLLDTQGAEIRAVIETDPRFTNEIMFFERACVLLLVRTYQDLFTTDIRIFRLFCHSCEQGWEDVAELLMDGYYNAFPKLSFFNHRVIFKPMCMNGWIHFLKQALDRITSTELLEYLVYISLRKAVKKSLLEVGLMFINDYSAHITNKTIKMLCGICCNRDNYRQESCRHEIINTLLDRFGPMLEQRSWHCIFKNACMTGCAGLLHRFATDLSSYIELHMYDRTLTEIMHDFWNPQLLAPIDGVLAFIGKFKERISTSVLQTIFESACSRANKYRLNCSHGGNGLYMALITGMLDCVSDRVSTDLVTTDLLQTFFWYSSLSQIQSLLKIYGCSMSSRIATSAIKSRWDEWDIVKALVVHEPTIVDAEDLIKFAINTIQEPYPAYNYTALDCNYTASDYSDTAPPLVERARYILNHFFTQINTKHIKYLFSLSSDELYQLLTIEDVKILVDDHKHEEGFDDVVYWLEPDHANTAYVLADYGQRGIKAHGF